MAYLHPVLRFIYFCLRIFAWLSNHLFYRHRRVLGREHLRDFHGPAIVVTNHPSTLMDVLNVGLPVPKIMFFLANYGLFKNPVSRWVLTRLYCIPVKRKEDVEAGDSRNNDSAFEQSFQHLEKQGILFIAPEGYSYMNRWVREFKTGTARIACGTESRNNWQLGMKIYPVGLSYSAANLFRSDVVINFGAPVEVGPWAAAWQKHRAQAVDALTAELQQRVTELTIHTRDEAGELLITRLEEIADNAHPLLPVEKFRRGQQLAQRYLDQTDLHSQVDDYFQTLQSTGLQDKGLAETQRRTGSLSNFWTAFVLTLGSPLFLLGYTFWWLPCFIPWLINKKLNLYIGYGSTIKIVIGALVFPLWLWGAYRLIRHFSASSGLAFFILTLLIVLAFFTELYQDEFRQFREKLKAAFFAKKEPAAWNELLNKRAEILAAIAI